MATLACERGRGTAHDRVVQVVAERFADPSKYRIKTCRKRGGRLRDEASPPMPDIAGCRRGKREAGIEWVAEVETEDTLSEAQAFGQWKRSAALLVPLYLIVPKGQRLTAESLAFRAGVKVMHVFEYAIEAQSVDFS